MLWAGIPKVTSVVGMVERDSPAAAAGLRPADRITSIDGVPVSWWEEVARSVREQTRGELQLGVERAGEQLQIGLALDARAALDMFGDVREIGWVGLDSRRLPALIGIPDGDTPAALAGLRSGDRVTKLDGAEVEEWEAFKTAYAAVTSGTVELELVRGIEEDSPTTTMRIPALGDLDALGVVSATILVSRVVEGSPAARAGLETDDLILGVDGRSVGSFRSFANTVRASEGRTLEIAYARNGEVYRVDITPEVREVPGPFGIEGMEEKVYQVGIAHGLATLPGEVSLDQVRNPLVALPRAARMTLSDTAALLRGLSKLVTFQLGADQLRGPITIIQIARKSLDRGWQMYLRTMIFISINLGILNLLPIPVLDGGQIMIFAFEGIKRSPISVRTRELVQQFGFIVLVMMMGLAFWNDLSGQWAKLVRWLTTEL
jgi:regulator of sigma E protease